jgi:hypothetical protein
MVPFAHPVNGAAPSVNGANQRHRLKLVALHDRQRHRVPLEPGADRIRADVADRVVIDDRRAVVATERLVAKAYAVRSFVIVLLAIGTDLTWQPSRLAVLTWVK